MIKKYFTNRFNINLFGNQLANFLKKFESIKNIIYIKDFVNMEWLRSLRYEAKKEK